MSLQIVDEREFLLNNLDKIIFPSEDIKKYKLMQKIFLVTILVAFIIWAGLLTTFIVTVYNPDKLSSLSYAYLLHIFLCFVGFLS